MALDNFRKINITLNKANQHILEPQITKVGDVNGRELVVQLIDGGVIKNQTSVTLKLNWQHANGNQGSESFKALDAKRGLFSVYYPKHMLFRGTVTANISINADGKITNSLNFQIAVQGDVFDGSAIEVDGILFTLKDLKNQLDERDENLENLENRQDSIENQFDDIQQEITDKDVISAPEIIAARNGEANLGERLDKEHQEVAAQLAHTYIIENEKFGIQTGSIDHQPPFTQEEYDIAYNNFEGIKRALEYAEIKGYRTVLFEKEDYVVCYQDPVGQAFPTYNSGWEIRIPSNMTVDLNGSCISVIYDSDNRNPYDKSKLPTWNLAGRIFTFSKTYNSTIQNGELKGDRYYRSYNNPEENKAEHTGGIFVEKGSKFNNIKNMKIHGFTGDAVCGKGSYDSDKGAAVTGSKFTFYPNYINSNGVVNALEGSYTTDFIDVTMVGDEVYIGGLGYVRTPDFADEKAIISYYDLDNTFISQETIMPLTINILPKNTAFIRLSILNEETGLDSLSKTFSITPPQPSFLTIENCEIYNHQRGGLSNLVNETVVQKNKMYANGMGKKEGWEVFFDPTRYDINCEDTVINNITIRDNYFADGFFGLLLNTLNFTVENNSFDNFEQVAVKAYENVKKGVVKNNRVYNSRGLIETTSTIKTNERIITVSNNTLENSHYLSNSNDDTLLIAQGNIVNDKQINSTRAEHTGLIYNEESKLPNEYLLNNLKGLFKDSVVNLRQPQYSTASTFLNTEKGSRDLTVNCSYNNKKISIDTASLDAKIYGLNMNKGTLYASINNLKGKSTIKDSNFDDIGVVSLNCYGDTASTDWVANFEDCDFTFDGTFSNLIELITTKTSTGKTDLVLNFKNCRFEIGSDFENKVTLFAVHHFGTNQKVTINLDDVTIDTTNANVDVELCSRIGVTPENDVVINIRDLTTDGNLTQSLNGYVVNHL